MRLPVSHRPVISCVKSKSVLLTLLVAALLTITSVALRHVDAKRDLKATSLSTHSQSSTQVQKDYGQLPLGFEVNRGQTNDRVRYIARGNGYRLFLTQNEAVFSLQTRRTEAADSVAGRAQILRMRMVGSLPKPKVVGLEKLQGVSHYLLGNDPSRWHRDVPSFSKVKYESVYGGIDLVYHGTQNQFEYDFVVSPGASPEKIQLAFEGADKIVIDEDGKLVLQVAEAELHQSRPVAYQVVGGKRREVNAKYRLDGKRVGFQLGSYDRTQPLTIDPVLIYSSFLGGVGQEQGLGIAVDGQSNAYLTGSTASTDFPLANALQTTKGAFNDAFVVKLNAGGALVYSTYLGANADDVANGIAVDSQGNAYVVGLTGSGGFPTTPGAFQTSKDGVIDGFISKLNSSGSGLVYSTFMGGDNSETLFGVAVDTAGIAYIAGRTDSSRWAFNFPGFTPRNGSPVHTSSNGGDLWTASGSGITASVTNAFAQDPVTATTFYAATNVGVFKTTNSGVNWSLTGSGLPTAPLFPNAIAIDPSNPNIIYVASSSGIVKSTDGGATYTTKNTGLATNFTPTLKIDPITPTTLYAGTILGVFKSTNGGDLWTESNNGITGLGPRVNEIVFDPTNAATIYIGTNRGLYKSTNSGALWTQINTGALANFTPSIGGLVIDPSNPSTLYAALNTAGPNVLYKTIDGGASWTASDTGLSLTVNGLLFPVLINELAINPTTPTTVYAATSTGGVFKSTNGGATWSQSNNGLPNRNANALLVDRTDANRLFVGVSIGTDALVIALSPTGSAPIYFLNFGGAESDDARAIAVDGASNAYVVGSTSSGNFPTVNAFDSSHNGFSDAFVVKLNPIGGIAYSTYLGGNLFDDGRGIGVRDGNAYVTGSTSSPDFPVVAPIKPTIAELDTDVFVSKFNTTGSGLDFSTYLGGENVDQGFGLAVNATGVYVTGGTFSLGFPVLDAFQPESGGSTDAFLTKLTLSGSALVHSTYLGGFFGDQGNGIAVDSAGNAYIIGTTSSMNFPTRNPFQSALKGTDAFVSKIGIEAELSITKTDSRDPVMVGNPLAYTLTVTNAGPSTATNVTVTDTLAAQLSFVSASATQGSCTFSNPTVTCQLGAVASGAGAVVNITTTPNTPATISNTATITASEPDSNTANNSATQSTKISASPSISGRVTDLSNTGVNGVLMTLSGGQAATTTTDATGFYQFPELPAGQTYVITPSKVNLSFNPQSLTFNNLNADMTADFLASVCTYALSPQAQTVPAAGGNSSVNVISLPGCPWTATSNSNFINLTSGSSGSGNGTVNFAVTATTAPRAGRLTIAGLNFPVYQEFGSCPIPNFAPAKYNAQDSPTVVEIADLNGDNRLDFVVANSGGLSSGGGLMASVLLNDGTGLFTLNLVDTGLGILSGGFVLADFNNDQRPDIALMNSFAPVSTRILFNNGSGGFGQQNVNIPFTSSGQFSLARRIFTADVNVDGKADLLLQPATDNIQILLGNGSGGFNQIAALNFNVADAPIGLADVNADGKPDLLFGSGNSDRALSVRLGDGTGAFGPAITSSTPIINSHFDTGDFNGDGNLDVVASVAVPNTGTNGFAILTGDGAGHFTSTAIFNPGTTSIGSATADDFNRDGKTDIAVTRGDTKVIYIPGDGIGGLGAPLEVSTPGNDQFPGSFGIASADFDGDTKPDIAVASATEGAFALRNACATGPAIFGRVTDSRNTSGIPGVTLTLTGTTTGSTQTDSQGNYFFANLTAGGNYVVTPAKDNFRFNPLSTPVNNLNSTQAANFVGTPIVVQFSQNVYTIIESTESFQVNVTRTGDLSGVTTVDYSTVKGTASDRSDYTAAIGSLRFEAGESQKSFQVLITNDVFVEGFEFFTMTLSNASGAILANHLMDPLPSSVTVQLIDNDFIQPTTNPLAGSDFFVRQHYHDFLNREPDPSGLQFWIDNIEVCGSDAQCREVKRINTSAAFFLSIEFQNTGYLVYKLYKTAYGDTTSPNVAVPVPIIRLNEFLPDSQKIAAGIIVGQPGWEQALVNNKAAFALTFVQRSRFINAYPLSMTADQFVTKLDQMSGGVLSAAEKDQLVAQLGATPGDPAKRASVVLAIAQDNDLDTREINRAFVLMQYFGYLRRNPDDPQDTDFRGWEFWLNKLNAFNGNAVAAEMVKAFLDSTEYRQRFGP